MEKPTREEFAAAFCIQWHFCTLEKLANQAQESLYSKETPNSALWLSGSLIHEDLPILQTQAESFRRKLEATLQCIRQEEWILADPVRYRCTLDVIKSYRLEAIELGRPPNHPCCFTRRNDRCVVLHCTMYDQPNTSRESTIRTKKFVVQGDLTLQFLLSLQWLGSIQAWMTQEAKLRGESDLGEQRDQASQMKEYDLFCKCFSVVKVFLARHRILI